MENKVILASILIMALTTCVNAVTNIPYYIDDENNLWIKTDLVKGDNTILINVSTTETPSAANTFIIGDDFDTFDTSYWNYGINDTATITASDGMIHLYTPPGTTNWEVLRSKTGFTLANKIIEFRAMSNNSNYISFIGAASSNSTYAISGGYSALRLTRNVSYGSTPSYYGSGVTSLPASTYGTSNTFYNYSISYIPSTVNVICDGSIWGTITNTLSGGTCYAHIGSTGPGGAPKPNLLVVDWYRVRDYIETEPTIHIVGYKYIGSVKYLEVLVTCEDNILDHSLNLGNIPITSGKASKLHIGVSSAVTSMTSDSYTKMFLHFDNGEGSTTFSDDTGRTWIPYNGAYQTATDSFLGASSGKFVKASKYHIDTSNIGICPGTQDFTFEWYMKPSTIGINQWIFGDAATTDYTKAAFMCKIDNNNYLIFQVGDGTNYYNIKSYAPIDTTNWRSYKVTRQGKYIRLYKAGELFGDGYIGDASIIDSSHPFSIGYADGGYENYYDGLIDEFRYSVGISRISGNSSSIIDYYCYGDSITRGLDNGLASNGSEAYIEQFKTHYSPGSVVDRNKDGAGCTADWGSSVMISHIRPGMKKVIVMFGTNDIRNNKTYTETFNNLSIIRNYARSIGADCTIMICPMTEDDGIDPFKAVAYQRAWIEGLQNMLDSAGISYIKAYDQIDTIPFDGIPEAADHAYYYNAYHPNAAGQLRIARLISQESRAIDITPPYELDFSCSESSDWRINGVICNNSTTDISYMFTKPGFYNVTATQYDYVLEQFTVYAHRPMASTFITPISNNVASTQDDILSINVTGFANDIQTPFTNLIGNMFYLILFSLPVVFLWINTGKLTTPTVIFLIFGWIAISWIPAQYYYLIWLAIACSIGAVAYKALGPR
jgi:lysophospholipase L1-like esterase